MKPATPDKVRERILHYASQPMPTEFPDGWKKALIGQLGRACFEKIGNENRTDMNRYLILGVILTPDGERLRPVNTKILWPQAWNALKKWIKPQYFEQTKKWHPRAEFKAECGMVLTFAKWAYWQIIQAQIAGKPEPVINDFLEAWAGYISDSEIDSDGAVIEAVKYMGAIVTGEGPRATSRLRGYDPDSPPGLTANQLAIIDQAQERHEEILKPRKRRVVRVLEES